MLRVVSVLVVLSTFNLPSTGRDASRQDSVQLAHVMVQLRGAPAAADPNLRHRSPATSWRFRLDPSLAVFQRYVSALDRYQSQEISYFRAKGIDISVGWRYHLLFNGFGAALPATQLNALRRLSNVVGIYPLRRLRPLLDHSLPLIHAPEAWNELGGAKDAGKGVKIANIDSGIDVKNPCFSDKGFSPPSSIYPAADTKANLKFTNHKIIVARAFGPDSQKQYSAQDVSGHGTFTAAIEACDYDTATPMGSRISGVAPAAYLLSYNIFPKDSDQAGNSDPFLAALEQAMTDGADVINVSVGNSLGPGDLRLDPDSAAVNVAIKAGYPVVIAAGNNGPTPQSVDSPAALPGAIAVGSSSNARIIASSLSVDGPGSVPSTIARIPAVEMSKTWAGTVGPVQVVDVGLGRRPGDDPGHPSADDYAGKDVKDKIVLVEKGNGNRAYITIETKVRHAQNAGARAVVMYDDRAELNPGTTDQGSTDLPGVFITEAQGKALSAWVRDHPDATLSLDSTRAPYAQPSNVLSTFSSRGYGAGYAIKPELVAPGEDIYSATESQDPSGDLYNPDGFVMMSGTSFSAPHVSGAAALLLQKHPTWTPAKVKSALMDTAGLDVYADVNQTKAPNVMQVGDGLVDAQAALTAQAYLTNPAVSFGEVNVGSGPVLKKTTIGLVDSGGGGGTWQVSLKPLRTAAGFGLDLPTSLNLPPGGQVSLLVKLVAAPGTPSGDYDGYIILSHGGQTIHAAYYAHVVSVHVRRGSVLLVDDTTSLLQPLETQASLAHQDLSRFYEKALSDLGRSYTYWNEATLGTPSLHDMKQASAVIYFTGNNLNDLGPQNSNYEALAGPLTSADVTVIHDFLRVGGRVFASGMGVALSDPYWSSIVMGGLPTGLAYNVAADDLSLFDNSKNDKGNRGGLSPARPSAVPDTNTHGTANRWIFGGLKAIDFSSKGNGANDNVATYSASVARNFGQGLVGVPAVIPMSGTFDFQGSAYGQGALRTTRPGLATAGQDVAVVSSDEPSLRHKPSYAGRSVLFTFGFEGINDNTGYATRDQVLRRIFQWFDDRPTALVSGRSYRAGRQIRLKGGLNAGDRAEQYTWQIGSRTLPTTGRPTSYRFARPGKYRVRVQITDWLGHTAVSPWTVITAR